MNVFTYWAGPKPAWIDICLDSMKRCCKQSELHILTPESKVLGQMHPRFPKLDPGVGTDYLRGYLLNRFGGLWIDADTVLIEDPIKLITNRHDPKQFLYSTWSAKPNRVIAGYVYSPAGHPVAKRWSDGVESAMQNAENIGWGDIGEKMLTPFVRANPGDTWEMDRETFMPIDIDSNVMRYFKSSGWRDVATKMTIGFGLNYSWMTDKMPNKMARMDSDYLIHNLLRDAEKANHAKQAS